MNVSRTSLRGEADGSDGDVNVGADEFVIGDVIVINLAASKHSSALFLHFEEM